MPIGIMKCSLNLVFIKNLCFIVTLENIGSKNFELNILDLNLSGIPQ